MVELEARRTLASLILASVVFAALVGIGAAVWRGVAVWDSTRHAQSDGTLGSQDRWGIEIMTAFLRIEPESERYRELEADVASFSNKYYEHPLATYLHIVPGALFFLFAPLQFSSRIRTRYLRFHRWSGRVLLASALPLGMSAFFFGAMPFGGRSESIATAVFGGFFFFAAGRALMAIRRRDVVHHREWMIRMFAIVIGVSTARVIDLILLSLTEASTRGTFGPSLWVAWIVTLGLAEGWIRYTRSSFRATEPTSVNHEAALTAHR